MTGSEVFVLSHICIIRTTDNECQKAKITFYQLMQHKLIDLISIESERASEDLCKDFVKYRYRKLEVNIYV